MLPMQSRMEIIQMGGEAGPPSPWRADDSVSSPFKIDNVYRRHAG
jgi:hypothetical protein